ncbi:MAG: LCP family protein [Longibaculum sp.]
MSKKTSVIRKITQWKIILGIQIISSLILIALIFKLGALPMKYAIVVIALVALLGIGMFFLMKPSHEKGKGKVRTVIGKVISILLSILLLIGSLYIAKGDSTISAITGANEQSTRFSVIVLKDSKYETLSDLKNESIQVNNSVTEEKEIQNEAIEAVQKENSSIKIKEVSDFNALSNNLYNKKVNAILVNEANYAMLEANHGDFQEKTKVIWSKDFVEKVEDFSKNVDVTKKPFVVYISGIDTFGPVSTKSRSDVNMIVTVNPKTKQILMTSIPRDYYVTLANKGKKDKLTHSGLAGVQNTVKTMENFMGIDINYYARVNFTSLIKMVDALGGVTVDIPKDFRANADGSYFKKGRQVINGKQALAFSRERYAFGDGDNARVHNQQIVLTAMINKMMSPAIITNYSSILSSIDGSFETNMAAGDITGLLQMQINDMASWKIIQKQMGGTGTMMTGGAYMPNNKLYYMIPNESSVAENKKAIQQVLAGNPVD